MDSAGVQPRRPAPVFSLHHRPRAGTALPRPAPSHQECPSRPARRRLRSSSWPSRGAYAFYAFWATDTKKAAWNFTCASGERLCEEAGGNCSKFPPRGERLPLLVLLGVSGMLLRWMNERVAARAAHFLTKMAHFYCVNAAFSPCGVRECLGELVEMRVDFALS